MCCFIQSAKSFSPSSIALKQSFVENSSLTSGREFKLSFSSRLLKVKEGIKTLVLKVFHLLKTALNTFGRKFRLGLITLGVMKKDKKLVSFDSSIFNILRINSIKKPESKSLNCCEIKKEIVEPKVCMQDVKVEPKVNQNGAQDVDEPKEDQKNLSPLQKELREANIHPARTTHFTNILDVEDPDAFALQEENEAPPLTSSSNTSSPKRSPFKKLAEERKVRKTISQNSLPELSFQQAAFHETSFDGLNQSQNLSPIQQQALSILQEMNNEEEEPVPFANWMSEKIKHLWSKNQIPTIASADKAFYLSQVNDAPGRIAIASFLNARHLKDGATYRDLLNDSKFAYEHILRVYEKFPSAFKGDVKPILDEMQKRLEKESRYYESTFVD